MLVVVIIVVEEKTLGLFHGRCGPFFIFWCSRCSGNKKNVKKLKNKHMLVKKRKKLMAQTTTKHRLGLFMGTGPFDSFPGVDGVGSGWPSSWYLVVVIVESRFKKKIHAGARDATYLEPPPHSHLPSLPVTLEVIICRHRTFKRLVSIVKKIQ